MVMLDIIKGRRTIRSFNDDNISKDDLVKILDAGNSAPCAGKLSNWKFIIIKYDKDKEKLARAAFNQEWMSNASVLIVVCSDSTRLRGLFGDRGEMYSVQNTSAAIENMLLEATALDIGSAWIGAFEDDKVKKVLEIPENIDIHAIVALGYSKERPSVAKLKLPDVVFFDKWGKSEEGENIGKKIADWLTFGKKP